MSPLQLFKLPCVDTKRKEKKIENFTTCELVSFNSFKIAIAFDSFTHYVTLLVRIMEGESFKFGEHNQKVLANRLFIEIDQAEC